MKEIKAYIDRSCVNSVVAELEKAGAPGITIVEAHAAGYGYEPGFFETRFVGGDKRYGYLRIIKLEVVCADPDVPRMVRAIRNASWAGAEAEGWIFVTGVPMGMRICDGTSGDEALASGPEQQKGKRPFRTRAD